MSSNKAGERAGERAVEKAIELKGGMYTFLSLRLYTPDLDAIDAALADKVHQAPAFFKDTPVVVDLDALDAMETTLDGAALLACIRRHRLDPIVASIGDRSSPLAGSIALPLIESGAQRRGTLVDGASGGAVAGGAGDVVAGAAAGAAVGATGNAASAGTDEALEPGGASASAAGLAREVEYIVRTPLLIDRPVRSGQQIYARDTDLIVMGQVGPGAEVIADNNIHVYGPLRGRALCGVSGNAATRIFCQSLEAELVSVAGNYRMLETIPEALRGRPAQVWLDEDRLNIEPL